MFRKHLPTRPYLAVSSFVAGDGTTVRSIDGLELALVDRGAEMGCDGIVLDKTDKTNDHEATRITAICIAYTDAQVPESDNLPDHTRRH